jgi:5-methylcytosine-specific restriction endonuclease McrA
VQGEVLEGELAVAAAEKGQEAKQLEQEGDHRTRIFSGSEPADQPLTAGPNFGEGHPAPTARLRRDSYYFSMSRRHGHHVVKRSQGGSDWDLDALVALCRRCHAQTDAPFRAVSVKGARG